MAPWKGLILLCVVGVPGANTPSGVVKELQGTWEVVSATQSGKTLDKLKNTQWTFAGEKITARQKDVKEQVLPLKVDPTKKPKEIDFPFRGGGLWHINFTIRGLYKLDGDHLTLCISENDNRPTEFSDKEATLLVLRRKK